MWGSHSLVTSLGLFGVLQSPTPPEPKTEILAPAGGFSSLSAALAAGADAVYFGVAGFNMRAGARNFVLTDLPAVVAPGEEIVL